MSMNQYQNHQQNNSKNKQNKYNYLQHSFQKQLQKSYDRKSRHSPPSITLNSPHVRSPHQKHHYYMSRSPRRSSQFSPYQNKQQNVRDKILVQQLKSHNRLLNDQIIQYKDMIDRLEAELRVRGEEIAQLDILRKKEKLAHQKLQAEMREEVRLLLTKNSYLDQRNIVLQKQLKKAQIQLSKQETRARSLSVTVAQSTKHSASKLLQQLASILENNPSKAQRRANGKLMNQTLLNVSNIQNNKPNLKNHSSKLLQKSLSQSSLINNVQILVHRVQKYEDLCDSILQMHKKITSRPLTSQQKHQGQGTELKSIWKWLKQLGHQFNINQKWKKILAQNLGIQNGNNINTDQVMQKVILKLHENQK